MIGHIHGITRFFDSYIVCGMSVQLLFWG